MTLDEAIKHTTEIAEREESYCHPEGLTTVVQRHSSCAAEHRQLAKWLEGYKEAIELLKQVVKDIEDFAANDPEYACHYCKHNYGDGYCPKMRKCFVWEYADRVKRLIGEENDVS